MRGMVPAALGLSVTPCGHHFARMCRLDADRFSRCTPRRLWLPADGNGSLDREEIKLALRGMPGTKDKDIDIIFSDMDTNKDGKISYQEFVDKFYA